SAGAWRRQRARSRLRIYREEEEPQTPVRVAAAPAVREVDEQLEARMDAVLRKVSDHGIESLTEQERNILLQASERIKRKPKGFGGGTQCRPTNPPVAAVPPRLRNWSSTAIPSKVRSVTPRKRGVCSAPPPSRARRAHPCR